MYIELISRSFVFTYMSTTMPALLLKVQSIVCFCILKGLPLFIFAFLVVFFPVREKWKSKLGNKTYQMNASGQRNWNFVFFIRRKVCLTLRVPKQVDPTNFLPRVASEPSAGWLKTELIENLETGLPFFNRISFFPFHLSFRTVQLFQGKKNLNKKRLATYIFSHFLSYKVAEIVICSALQTVTKIRAWFSELALILLFSPAIGNPFPAFVYRMQHNKS
jgi:hypothetical protein